MGLLMSDVKHDYIRSRMTPISALTPDDVNAVFAQLEAQARDDLRRDGFSDNEIRIERALDMRYAGQGYEMTIACTAEQTTALDALRKTFDAEHKAHVRPHGARGAGRSRVLSGARRRPRAGRRPAEIQAAGPFAMPMRCAKRARCASTARRYRARSISAKSSMSA